MRCLNCGKDVPYDGKVCPWCHGDKGSSQKASLIGLALAAATGLGLWQAFGVIAGVIGLVVGAVFFGALVREIFRARG
jgi:hypothetical protein